MAERLTLPVVPLRDTVLFPGLATPITVGRVRTLRAVELALRLEGDDKRVFAVAQRDGAEEPMEAGLYAVGVIARIAQVQRVGTGLSLVLQCEKRATALRYFEEDGICRAACIELADVPRRPVEEPAIVALAREVRERAIDYGKRRGAPESALEQFLGNIEDPSLLSNHVAFYLDLPAQEKQNLLETLKSIDRLRSLTVHLHRQIGIAETQEKIRTSVQEELGERQRELYLREQLKAIQKELGDDDEAGVTDRLEKKIDAAELPTEAREEVRRELGRLRRMNRETSPEAQVLTSWLESVGDLPWNKRTDDHVDLEEAKRILDEDHHGLEDVKERVLELLSVIQLRMLGQESSPDKAKVVSRGPILLFVGPPGTGKTSIAESIARAMGRKYVRVSLGGARDEADIRGHRRTYVGAMPGRILQGMRRVGSKNPVFTLDEIDKLGVSYQGDPAAALLEVLDPAQNTTFVDHYLGLPFDLSEVLFVCTANLREGIPPPLLDRMELIRFPGYTEIEKLSIARRYLLPKQRCEAALADDQLDVSDRALAEVITGYTHEAGVRQLERAIGTLARRAARKVAAGEAERVSIETAENVRTFLRRPKARPTLPLEHDEPGVATGMYYTQEGGDIMHVEATVVPGKGELVLTGQLGDVMKESGRAAMTYARAHGVELGVPRDRLEGQDCHVHVPAGAVPKDGPSAGVTMATALVSALTGRPVRKDVAMTGEVTLRGRVLPIGGVKEKVLGAHRAGIPEVILPRENEADLEDLPEEVLKSVHFHFVDTLDEVLALALRPARIGTLAEIGRATDELKVPRAA